MTAEENSAKHVKQANGHVRVAQTQMPAVVCSGQGMAGRVHHPRVGVVRDLQLGGGGQPRRADFGDAAQLLQLVAAVRVSGRALDKASLGRNDAMQLTCR